MVRTTSHQAIVGLAALGVSLIACVMLVADFVYGSGVALLVALPMVDVDVVRLANVGRWRRDPPLRE